MSNTKNKVEVKYSGRRMSTPKKSKDSESELFEKSMSELRSYLTELSSEIKQKTEAKEKLVSDIVKAREELDKLENG